MTNDASGRGARAHWWSIHYSHYWTVSVPPAVITGTFNWAFNTSSVACMCLQRHHQNNWQTGRHCIPVNSTEPLFSDMQGSNASNFPPTYLSFIAIFEVFSTVISPPQYSMRYYFNVHSKAHISQLNLPHGTKSAAMRLKCDEVMQIRRLVVVRTL